jgi:hypothetical protein
MRKRAVNPVAIGNLVLLGSQDKFLNVYCTRCGRTTQMDPVEVLQREHQVLPVERSCATCKAEAKQAAQEEYRRKKRKKPQRWTGSE